MTSFGFYVYATIICICESMQRLVTIDFFLLFSLVFRTWMGGRLGQAIP